MAGYINESMLRGGSLPTVTEKFVGPEAGRILRKEMGYKVKSESCKTCAYHKEVDDPQLDSGVHPVRENNWAYSHRSNRPLPES